MNKKETEVIIQRIEKWYGRLPGLFIFDQKKFQSKFGWSKNATKFGDRMSLDYKSINEGDPWGQKWESAWVSFEGRCAQGMGREDHCRKPRFFR